MILDELNNKQREAAERTEGALVVLAGAGSGKTKTLTARAANIIESLDVWPGNMLCITFTNKAAREMKERIHKAVGTGAQSMWIHTFHGMCARILRAHGDALGYTRDFTIYDTADSLRLIKRCLKDLDMDEKFFQPRTMLDMISKAKNHYADPRDYFNESPDFLRRKSYDVFRLYEKEQREANAMDFDNLLLKTIDLLEKHEDVLSYYANKFQYVMVDEYQDTNPAQYRLIRLLCSAHGNICVVGDDDQSIYGWRGADIRNILEFEQDFPGAVTIRLEQNYRSYGHILNAANSVIAHNVQRKGKNLFTTRGDGYPVMVYRAATEKGEADYVIGQIDDLSAEYRYEDMAVLYRINSQSRAVEEALMRSGIPYKVYGGMKFYDRREVKDIVALLRFLQNPRDDLSLYAIINVPKRGIGDAAIAALSE
ncbi:MAG: ATP-dependent DNA helicase PcrA, partial [Clostridiales bacterium]|nr:ATP-dependent DNA helicase PcrA [Clostridiales bacterium]